MNPMVGPVCLSLGMIGLALGIHDRITRSLFSRRYLVATYTDRSASRLLRTAPFWRIPIGICLIAAGLALTLGGNSGALLTALWAITAIGALVAVIGWLRPVAPLKPAWFRREELEGFPILETPDVTARKPLFIWILSLAVFVPLGIVLFADRANPGHLLLLIAIGIGAAGATGAAAAYPKWSRKAPPSARALQ
jgi:hypothetical protein